MSDITESIQELVPRDAWYSAMLKGALLMTPEEIAVLKRISIRFYDSQGRTMFETPLLFIALSPERTPLIRPLVGVYEISVVLAPRES